MSDKQIIIGSVVAIGLFFGGLFSYNYIDAYLVQRDQFDAQNKEKITNLEKQIIQLKEDQLNLQLKSIDYKIEGYSIDCSSGSCMACSEYACSGDEITDKITKMDRIELLDYLLSNSINAEFKGWKNISEWQDWQFAYHIYKMKTENNGDIFYGKYVWLTYKNSTGVIDRMEE